MNIKSLFLITILITIFSALPSSASITINSATNMPDNIVAGSTYQVNYTFTTSQQMNISMNFSVLHTEIDFDDWNVWYVLNDTVIIPDEPLPGQFTSGYVNLNASEHDLIITFSSIPNLTPGEYLFKVDIISDEDEPVKPSPKKSSGGGRRYPTPTPTPMPINATETPTPVPTDELNETEMYINVTEPSQEQDDNNLYLYGIAVILSAIMVAFLYRKRKGE